MSPGLISLYVLTILYGLMPTKNSKLVKRYFWLWCAFVFCILTLTSNVYADLYNYENYYDDINVKKWDITYRAMPLGWGVFCQFFGKFGMTYRGMFTCVIILSMFLTHRFVTNLDCNEKCFWGLYMIFPGLIQVVQLRFFLGSSIAMYAFGFIFQNSATRRNKIKNIMCFVVGIWLAFMIHSSCAFLLILFFTIYFKKINVGKAFAISFFSAMALTVLLPYIPRILSVFIQSFYIERYFTASTSKTTIIRFLKILVVWFANVGLAIFTLKSNKFLLINDAKSWSGKEWIVSKCFAGIIILAVSLPLLYFDENFHRFFEMGFMLLYIIFAKLSIRENSYNVGNRRTLLVLNLVCLMYCIYVYYPFESIVYPLFTYDGFAPMFR